MSEELGGAIKEKKDSAWSQLEQRKLLKDLEELPLVEYEDVRTISIEKALNNDSQDVQILKLVECDFGEIVRDHKMAELWSSDTDFKRLKKLVYIFSGSGIGSSCKFPEWEHSYACSVLMRAMIDENELPVSVHLPLAALLHDIGKMFMKKHRARKFRMAEEFAEARKLPLYMAEKDFMKITHADAGGILLRTLEMPEEIIIPVSMHHTREIPEKYVLETALLKFTDWVDCTVRRRACSEPEMHVMNAAGIESIDDEYWIRRHREIVCDVHNQYFSDSNTQRLKKVMKREKISMLENIRRT